MAGHGSPGLGLGLSLLATALLCSEQLPVKTYTTAEGLAGNLVDCIVQDNRGFLWFCASGGLSRFDGYTFVNYPMKVGLLNPYMTSFQVTRLGIYWVGTMNGLFRLDANPSAPQKFEMIRVGATENSQRVTALAEGHNGALWVGTWDGLYRLEAGQRAFQSVEIGIPPRADAARDVGIVLVDRQDSLWIYANDRLYRRAPDGRIVVYRDSHFATGLLTLYEDRKGTLWAGTNEGLCRLNTHGGPNDSFVTRVYTKKDGLPHDRIEAVLETSDGRLWAGGVRGLSYYVPEADRFESYTRAQGLSDANIKSLAEDREGSLWVGTEAGGTMKIARRGFTSYTEADGLADTRVASVLVDRAGELCTVTSNLFGKWVLDCFDGKRFTPIQPNYPSSIHYFGWGWNQTAFQDHTGEWWIPTGQGLCRFAKTSRAAHLAGRPPKAVYTTRDGLPQNDIFRLFEDSHGNVWICGAGQIHDPLVRWERAKGLFHVFSAADGLPEIQESATAFAEDSSGQIWIGYYSRGHLARFRNGRFRLYSSSDGVPAGRINALHLDHAGRLWIAGSLGGLARIDNPLDAQPRFIPYTISQGLSSNAVFCLTEDQWGRIYAGTARGVDRLDPATGRIKHYTTADGLAPGSPGVAGRDRQGGLWFGSLLGLSRLIPEPDRPASPPPVFITGLQVRGVSQPTAELGQIDITGLVFRPNQNQVRIDFVGVGFAPGESLRYQYRLGSAESDWSAPTDQRSVNYASLRAGSYKFEVRAVNAEGAMSPQAASVAFTLLAPVWRRWWFVSTAVFALGLLVYAVYRYRVAQLLAVERIRMRIATDLHDDIGSSLSQIAILSEVARRQGEGATPKLAGPLSDIAAMSGELVDGMSDIVWAINPKHDHFGNLEYRMRRFANDALAARDIEVEFRSASADPDLPIGADVRRQIYLVFKEAVNNIARHADASQVIIEFAVTQDNLVLRVADDGIGFDPASAGAGNGLMNIRKRASDLGGAVALESKPNGGTTLTLLAPLAHQYWWGRRVGK